MHLAFINEGFLWSAQALGQVLVWIGCLQCIYTFLIYPLAIQIFARVTPCDPVGRLPSGETQPRISIIIAAHNEEACIRSRIENLLQCDYPSESVEIILVSDGSTDRTIHEAESVGAGNLRVIARTEKSGKPACLNAAVEQAVGEWIIFADARQSFAVDALQHLSRHFGNPSVGAVSGQLFPHPSTGAAGQGIDFYWRLEKGLRHAEARLDSCIGCTGAIYALRRKLYCPLPGDILLDDVVIPMEAALQGKRILFEPEAKAFDPQRFDPALEKMRKTRTLAGNFQMLLRYPQWLLPWRNRLWWKLFSHKYSRLLTPVALVFALTGAWLARDVGPYSILLLGQLVLYGMAVVGMLWRGGKLVLLSVPAGFLFLSVMIVRGFFYYLSGSYKSGWEKSRGPG